MADFIGGGSRPGVCRPGTDYYECCQEGVGTHGCINHDCEICDSALGIVPRECTDNAQGGSSCFGCGAFQGCNGNCICVSGHGCACVGPGGTVHNQGLCYNL